MENQQITETNKELIKTLYRDVYVHWNMEILDELIAPEFVDHDMPPGMPVGVAGFVLFYGMLRTAFPDLRYTVQDIIAENDKVVVRWKWHATHQGIFFGMEATGKNADTEGIAIYRLAEGKIVERWVKVDMHGLLRKLSHNA